MLWASSASEKARRSAEIAPGLGLPSVWPIRPSSSSTPAWVCAGFRIKRFFLSIDDFGTGYSSLTQLQRLPFSEIKIDKSFVIGMEKTEESAIIAKTVVDMGHNLGLSVCAEGVENEKVLSMLQGFGCDFVQGFYFSGPVAADKVPDFVNAIDGVRDGDLGNWSQGAVA